MNYHQILFHWRYYFSIPLDLDLSLRNSNSGLEVNQAPTTTGLCNEGIIHWQMQC